MKRRWKNIGLIICGVAIIAMAYQNCAPQPDSAESSSSSPEGAPPEDGASNLQIKIQDTSDNSVVTGGSLEMGRAYIWGLFQIAPAGTVVDVDFPVNTAQCTLTRRNELLWRSSCTGSGQVEANAQIKLPSGQVLSTAAAFTVAAPTPTPNFYMNLLSSGPPEGMTEYQIRLPYRVKSPAVPISIQKISGLCRLGRPQLDPENSEATMTVFCAPGTVVLRGSQPGSYTEVEKSFVFGPPTSIWSLMADMPTAITSEEPIRVYTISPPKGANGGTVERLIKSWDLRVVSSIGPNCAASMVGTTNKSAVVRCRTTPAGFQGSVSLRATLTWFDNSTTNETKVIPVTLGQPRPFYMTGVGSPEALTPYQITVPYLVDSPVVPISVSVVSGHCILKRPVLNQGTLTATVEMNCAPGTVVLRGSQPGLYSPVESTFVFASPPNMFNLFERMPTEFVSNKSYILQFDLDMPESLIKFWEINVESAVEARCNFDYQGGGGSKRVFLKCKKTGTASGTVILKLIFKWHDNSTSMESRTFTVR